MKLNRVRGSKVLRVAGTRKVQLYRYVLSCPPGSQKQGVCMNLGLLRDRFRLEHLLLIYCYTAVPW